jgi:hypothetical protein
MRLATAQFSRGGPHDPDAAKRQFRPSGPRGAQGSAALGGLFPALTPTAFGNVAEAESRLNRSHYPFVQTRIPGTHANFPRSGASCVDPGALAVARFTM